MKYFKLPFTLMEPEGPAFARNIILDANGQGVGSAYLPMHATFENSKAEGEELARMFCAAPDLLKACKLLLAKYQNYADASFPANEKHPIEVALEAIAKAEGKP